MRISFQIIFGEIHKCQSIKSIKHEHTFVPVPEGGHDVETDGLVGALLQDGGGEALVCPSQTCSQEDTEPDQQVKDILSICPRTP